MKAGWEKKTLDQIAENLDSKRIPITKADRVSGEYPYYGASGIVDYVADYIFDCDTLLISEDGANLIARSTPVAFPASGKYWVNNHAHILKFENMTTQRFVELYLESIPLDEYITGAAQPKLNQKALNSIPIPFPPHAEQQRIIGILDEAFDGIATAKANAEKNLQNARALFESHLQSVFTQRGEGWVEKRLKDVCEKITDGTHQTPTYFDEGVLFLSSRNVTSGKIDWDKIKYIDTKQHLEMHKRVAPRLHDILLAKNGTTGVAAIVDRDVVFDIYVSLALLRALDVISPYFLLYFINSSVAKEQFNKRLKGVGVPNLHLQEIREVTVSFPKSLAEQNLIVSKLDILYSETQHLETIYKKKLAALDALKKSLLDQAFTGQL
ncbi:MAG: restriction endonuclease subunit S [Desulfosalsimonadaceae bacterium]